MVEVAEVPGELGDNRNVICVHDNVHHDNKNFLVVLLAALLTVGSQPFLKHQH